MPGGAGGNTIECSSLEPLGALSGAQFYMVVLAGSAQSEAS